MKPSSIAQGILQAILYLFLIAVGIYALYLLQSLITYILIAAVISLIGRPITVFLNTKLKFGNTLAVVSTMIFFLIILFGLLSLFVPLILQQGENLSLPFDALEIKITRLLKKFLPILIGIKLIGKAGF